MAAATLVRDLKLSSPVVRTVDGVEMSSDSSDIQLGAVRFSGQQSLTEEQKAQARANIGAGSAEGEGTVKSVSVNGGTAENPDANGKVNLTIPLVKSVDGVQLAQGAENIPLEAVRYGAMQELTDEQKFRARENIGAGVGNVKAVSLNGGDGVEPNPMGTVNLSTESLLSGYTFNLNDTVANRMEQLANALHAVFGLVVIPKGA